MSDYGSLYKEARERIIALVRGLPDEDLERVVPTCPEWRVRDLLAHLSGVCTDILTGNLDGVTTEPWTAAQVDARRDWSVEQLLEEWETAGPKCEELAPAFPPVPARQWVTDVTTHEHDIRCALEKPGARDSAGVSLGFEALVERMDAELRQDGRPALRILTDEGDDRVAGEGRPQTTLRAPRFELVRALTGRRSEEQVAAMDWSGDYRAYVDVFGRPPFSLAATAIAE